MNPLDSADNSWLFSICCLSLVVYFLVRFYFQKKKANLQKHPRLIQDNYKTLEEVSEALRKAGLESCNLIVGIDYTKSNEYTGKFTFGGKSLHYIFPPASSPASFSSPSPPLTLLNPYQQVIQILGETLAPFDEDQLIPTFGFGDITTKNSAVFPFFTDRIPYKFHQVLERYTEITPLLNFSGPTNFGPLIRKAIQIVKEARDFHILIIIADGQVTDVQDTRMAICEASSYPLSILLVGVGDGPWDQMKEFDDELPRRQFDNFQFIDFHKIMMHSKFPETTFALNALMEIPQQIQEMKRLNLFDFPKNH